MLHGAIFSKRAPLANTGCGIIYPLKFKVEP
jgi:hypothetical protein